MELKFLELEVVDSSTILIRVIQVIKKQNIQIISFHAQEPNMETKTGLIKLSIWIARGKNVSLKRKLEGVIDVISVKEIEEEIKFDKHDFVPAY